jgi:hypothetical protein
MTSAVTFEDFEAIEVKAEETTIFLRRFGSGPAVLLLHGFPQTHVMWRSMAPLLARHAASGQAAAPPMSVKLHSLPPARIGLQDIELAANSQRVSARTTQLR